MKVLQHKTLFSIMLNLCGPIEEKDNETKK